MNLTKTSNPVFGKQFLNTKTIAYEGKTMTVQGTMNKTFVLFALLLAGAYYTWKIFFSSATLEAAQSAVMPWMIGTAIGGFVMAIITSFARKLSPYTTPIYAILEGLFLGAISAFFEAMYPGIILQAVGLTMATFFAMLFLYKTQIIRVTRKFFLGVMAATIGIGVFYLIGFILSLFGMQVGILYGNSMLSIGLSLVIVVIAALNLVLDFAFIEQASQSGAPKYMEWYGAFGLMVTLVWLYIEILRLLAKISSRN
jgi:uncharacterized YccA/Bax inhibitor family protein